VVSFFRLKAFLFIKLKFQDKILSAAKNDTSNFLISFMGSSVTAGHDSPFNQSFPILTGKNMEKAFAAVNIQLTSINAAMGNNPCMPYDVCVKTFSSADADIVHWEQQFNVSFHLIFSMILKRL
jgi:hypothetical protein